MQTCVATNRTAGRNQQFQDVPSFDLQADLSVTSDVLMPSPRPSPDPKTAQAPKLGNCAACVQFNSFRLISIISTPQYPQSSFRCVADDGMQFPGFKAVASLILA